MSSLTQEQLSDLRRKARTIRGHIVRTVSNAGVGHVGGSLSETDILTTLYFHVMNVDPANPAWAERDRFVLSKGHGACGLYSVLAERGFFPRELLNSFGRIDSKLQVHPDMHLLPGIEMSTGALGQGISVAVGMAMAARMDGRSLRIYCLIGDGECQEGQVWEAAESAAYYGLDNLTVILDYNRVQLMGPLKDILEIAPVFEKWRSFNWNVIDVNGHDIAQLADAFEAALQYKGKPTILIANTVKGKGVSFMEGKSAWHGKPPNSDELAQALQEIQAEGGR
jgi:transketolase